MNEGCFSIDTEQVGAIAMQWFKMYHEFATDPKVQAMPEAMQRRLVMLFCLQCSGDLAKLEDEEIALALRISAEELEQTRSLFIRKGFIGEDWSLPSWDKRQTSTDPTAAARMQRYRNKLRAKGETSYGYDRFRNLVMKRDRGACVYCGSTENPCLDHMVPVDRGGDSQPDNLAIACKACNSGKSGRLVEETGYRFLNKEVAALYESAKQRLGVTTMVTGVTVTPSNSLRVELELEQERELEAAAASRAHARDSREGGDDQPSEPEYPADPKRSPLMIAPGPFDMPEETARTLWSLLWEGWHNASFLADFYQRQRFHKAESWREAIRIAAGRHAKPRGIGYFEAIAAECDLSGIQEPKPRVAAGGNGRASPRPPSRNVPSTEDAMSLSEKLKAGKEGKDRGRHRMAQ